MSERETILHITGPTGRDVKLFVNGHDISTAVYDLKLHISPESANELTVKMFAHKVYSTPFEGEFEAELTALKRAPLLLRWQWKLEFVRDSIVAKYRELRHSS